MNEKAIVLLFTPDLVSALYLSPQAPETWHADMLNFTNIEIGKKYERPWLAKEWGYRSYRAFAKGVFCPRNSKQIILFVTRIKQRSLEQYNDYISGEYLFWEGEKGHGHDERIANSTSSGEIG